MPFAGTAYPPTTPSELQPFSLDFTPQMENDSIASVSTALTVAVGSDPNASDWLVSTPAVVGNVVTQEIGGVMPGGLQPGVTYIWTVVVDTANGYQRINYIHIPCQAVS